MSYRRPILNKMLKVANDNWDLINEKVTDLFVDLAQNTNWKPPYVFQEAFATVSPEDMLGCGYWGCVYPIDTDQRFVVKMTIDPTEGPFVSKLLDDDYLVNNQGIVRYLAVWELEEEFQYRGKGHTLYVIVREEADVIGSNQASQDDPRFCDMLSLRKGQLRLGYLHLAAKAKVLQARLKEKHTRLRENMFDQAISQWYETVSALGDTPKGYALANFAMQMYEQHEVILADVHANNIGYRKHSLGDIDIDSDLEASEKYFIITDPGHSFVYDYPEIEVIGR